MQAIADNGFVDVMFPRGERGREGTVQWLLLDRLFSSVRAVWWIVSGVQRGDNQGQLEHDTRWTMFKMINAYPGQTLTDLARETDISRVTIEHHARVLSHEGLLTSERRRGKHHYFSAIDETPAKCSGCWSLFTSTL